MAEQRERNNNHELLSVVINFESLRFMTLVNESYFISDLIAEVEETFTKLCSTRVTIKTLKNSVNAVLPDWYPVVPLIKNGDEIFAFRDTAVDVLNNNFSKPTNELFKYPSTHLYNSGLSNITFEKDQNIRTDQLETMGRNDDSVLTSGPIFNESMEPEDALSDEQSEYNEKLSETFSLQHVKGNNGAVNNDQGVATENEVGQKLSVTEDGESKTSTVYNLVVTGKKKKASVGSEKSKKRDSRNSDSMDERGNNLEKPANVTEKLPTNDSGVSLSGRSSIVHRSKASGNKSAQKLSPEQSTNSVDKDRKVDGKSAKTCSKESKPSSRTNSDKSTCSSSSDESSVDERKTEETPVQTGSPVDNKRRKSNLEEIKKEQGDSMGNIPSKDEDSSDPSSDSEEDMVVNAKICDDTLRESAISEDENNSVDDGEDEEMPEKTLPERAKEKSPLAKSASNSKDMDEESSDGDEGNIPTVPAKGTEDRSQKGDKDEVEVSENETGSIGSNSSESTKLNSALEFLKKGKTKKPKIISIKITKPTRDSGVKKVSPAAVPEIKAEKDEADSDDESSWTGSSDTVDSLEERQDDAKGCDGETSKAKTIEATAHSDTESSDSQKPLAQVIEKKNGISYGSDKKTNGKNVKTLAHSDDESNDGGSEKPLPKLTANVSDKKIKGKTTEKAADSDNESSDSSSEKPFTKPAAKRTVDDQAGTSSSDDEEPLTQPPTKTTSKSNATVEAAAESDSESSESSSSEDKKHAPLPAKDITKSKDVVDKSVGKPEDSDSVNTKNSTEKNAKSLQSNAKQRPESPERQQSDPKTSPPCPQPQSPVTPRSRKAAVDKSTSKVASWLLANDVYGSGSTSDQGRIMTRAQRSRKRAKKNAGGKKGGNNKTQSQLTKDMTTEPKLPKNKDAIECAGEPDAKDQQILATPKTTRKSRKRKGNTKAEVADEIVEQTSGPPKTLAKFQKQKQSEVAEEEKVQAKSQTAKQNDNTEGKEVEQSLDSPKSTHGKSQKRKQNEIAEGDEKQSPIKNGKKRKKKKQANGKSKANNDDQQQMNDNGKTKANLAVEQPVDTSKRKALKLPKKSKGLSVLLEDDDDDDNFRTPKKPKRTPVWSDRPKPVGFLTPLRNAKLKNTGSRSRKKKLSSSQPKQAVELNVKEKELLSSGALNLDTLLNDESITW